MTSPAPPLSLMRAAEHELEVDTSMKHAANEVDGKAHGLKNTSGDKNYHQNIETVDNQ